MKPVKAKDLMPDLLVTIRKDATLEEAARLMLHADIGSLLVVDPEGMLLGIVTDTDFGARPPDGASAVRAPHVLGEVMRPGEAEQTYREARTRRVEDIMSRAVIAVEEDVPVSEMLELMYAHRVRHIAVVRDGKALGVVSTRDLLHLLFEDSIDPVGAAAVGA